MIRKHPFLFILAVVATAYIGLIVVYNVSKPSSKPSVEVSPEVQEQITPNGLYIAINETRAELEIPSFSRNDLLDKSAKKKCSDMVKNDYYGHDNPETKKHGYSYIGDEGVSYAYASENLNKGNFKDAKEVVESWLESEAHKASIIDPKYTEIGFAVCKQDENTVIVQHKIEVVKKSEQAQQTQNNYPRTDYLPDTTTCTHGYDWVTSQPTTRCTTY